MGGVYSKFLQIWKGKSEHERDFFQKRLCNQALAWAFLQWDDHYHTPWMRKGLSDEGKWSSKSKLQERVDARAFEGLGNGPLGSWSYCKREGPWQVAARCGPLFERLCSCFPRDDEDGICPKCRADDLHPVSPGSLLTQEKVR